VVASQRRRHGEYRARGPHALVDHAVAVVVDLVAQLRVALEDVGIRVVAVVCAAAARHVEMAVLIQIPERRRRMRATPRFYAAVDGARIAVVTRRLSCLALARDAALVAVAHLAVLAVEVGLARGAAARVRRARVARAPAVGARAGAGETSVARRAAEIG